MNVGGYTAIGPRSANEDSFYYLDFSDLHSIAQDICVFAMVSDGMGGYQGGDVASGLAVACAKSYLLQLVEMANANRIDLDAPAALAEIVQNAHESILAEANARGNLSMGATFVGVFASRTHAWIGHVGDSRCYLVHDGSCLQLTEDHSRVGRMLSRGIITEEEAQNHPDRNRIERALGFNDARVDVTEVDLVPGDALLLCSDGVYTVLDANALGSCVLGARDAAAAAERAVKLAVRRGTDDNSTAVVVMDGFDNKQGQRTATPTIVALGETQANVPTRAANSSSGTDATFWSRALPPALALLLAIASAGLVMRGCAEDAQIEGTVLEEADESLRPDAAAVDGKSVGESPIEQSPTQGQDPSQEEGGITPETEAVAEQVPTQGTGQVSEEPATSDGATPTDYDYITIPLDVVVSLKYTDQSDTAQLFSYEPFNLMAEPRLLPGATVAAQAPSGSYGRIEKTYQLLSDEYLADLRGDISSYTEGSTTFDSTLSRLIEPSDYLALVQGLAQTSPEALDSVIGHLAIEALAVTGQ